MENPLPLRSVETKAESGEEIFEQLSLPTGVCSHLLQPGTAQVQDHIPRSDQCGHFLEQSQRLYVRGALPAHGTECVCDRLSPVQYMPDRRGRDLVTLRTDLPLAYDWEDARVSEPNYQRLLELFEDFGFRRYADEQRTLASESGMKEAGEHERRWQVVRTQQEFDTFVETLAGKGAETYIGASGHGAPRP